MKFRFNMPVNLKFGSGIVKENIKDFNLGKKALIVTGRNSAKVSGALDDVLDILNESGIRFGIFDKAENNPGLDNVADGADFCKDIKADFIIAIGGGSPMDAAKAIAALATNDIEPIELITSKPVEPFLPIIAIPTTSGTGSEVTPFSVLTVPSMNTKRSFTSQWSFPKVAFADPGYTKSLPYNITVDTAYDAFSHLLESYFSKRSSPLNDSIAIEGMKVFSECMDSLINNDITYDIREKLMYASCLGGMAITHTGTTLVHAMGYSLTYYKGLSHGRANALIMAEYLKYNSNELPDKVESVLRILGLEKLEEADDYFMLGNYKKPVLNDSECSAFAALAAGQGSVRMNPRTITEEGIYNLYKSIFGGSQ